MEIKLKRNAVEVEQDGIVVQFNFSMLSNARQLANLLIANEFDQKVQRICVSERFPSVRDDSFVDEGPIVEGFQFETETETESTSPKYVQFGDDEDAIIVEQ